MPKRKAAAPKKPRVTRSKALQAPSGPPAGNVQVLEDKQQVSVIGRPRKYQSVTELQRLIDDYFKDCKEDGRIATVTGLAASLDMDRRQLIDYQGKPLFNNTISKAKRKVEAGYEEAAMSGKANATFSIFTLKNNFKWQDKIEIDQLNTLQVTHTLDPALAQKFTDLLKQQTIEEGLIEG